MPTMSPKSKEWVVNCFPGIGDSSPPKTLLKQEGLQLAEASFRDMQICAESNVDSSSKNVPKILWLA